MSPNTVTNILNTMGYQGSVRKNLWFLKLTEKGTTDVECSEKNPEPYFFTFLSLIWNLWMNFKRSIGRNNFFDG